MTLHRYVNGYGTIEAAPATANQPAAGGALAAPSAGIVAKLNVVAGQRVQKGDVLMELNSGHCHIRLRESRTGTPEEIVRATKYVAEKCRGRRGAIGFACKWSRRFPARSPVVNVQPGSRWIPLLRLPKSSIWIAWR